jgi:hypothetical protein
VYHSVWIWQKARCIRTCVIASKSSKCKTNQLEAVPFFQCRICDYTYIAIYAYQIVMSVSNRRHPDSILRKSN